MNTSGWWRLIAGAKARDRGARPAQVLASRAVAGDHRRPLAEQPVVVDGVDVGHPHLRRPGQRRGRHPLDGVGVHHVGAEVGERGSARGGCRGCRGRGGGTPTGARDSRAYCSSRYGQGRTSSTTARPGAPIVTAATSWPRSSSRAPRLWAYRSAPPSTFGGHRLEIIRTLTGATRPRSCGPTGRRPRAPSGTGARHPRRARPRWAWRCPPGRSRNRGHDRRPAP